MAPAFDGRLGVVLLKIAARLLPLLLSCQLFSGSTAAQQSNALPRLNPGDAVVTGFSGTITADPTRPRPANKSAADLAFINPDGPSARIVGIGRPGYFWDGRLLQAPKVFDVFAKDVGQIFGVALDDQPAPNIYLAATAMFGLNLVDRGRDGLSERRKVGGPGAGWMKGQFGLDLQGDPGSIYRVDGTTGVVTLFAKVMLNGVPNPGPALGNLAYDAAHKQIFVSDLYTGMIHRFAIADGGEPGLPYDHGTTGRSAANQAAMPFDPAKRPNIASGLFNAENPDSWGFAPPERRVWGLAVHNGRLFYSVRNGAAVEGPQIWSVGVALDGGFGSDARLEIEIAAQPGPYPVSDIAFSQQGAMILAQRAPIAASYDYSLFTGAGEPRVLRYWLKEPNDPPSPGLWKPMPDEYAIGMAGTYRNTDGGVALGYGYGPDGSLSEASCEGSLWSTGQNLRNNPSRRGQLEPGGPLLVNGLQGSPADLVRSANEPPTISYFIDYDDRFDDASASGHLGSVRILARPCATPVANAGRPAITVITTTTPAGCVGPNCRIACTPTCVCPPGTVLEGRECVKVKVCPPGTVLQNGECRRVETLIKCTPPMVSNSGGTACICPQGEILVGGTCVKQTCTPPLVPGAEPGSCVCPPGTVREGRQCVPVTQTCTAPLVPGPCTCPEGTVQDGGFCVSAKPIDLGIIKTGGTTPFCPAPNYDFVLTVTNVGNGFPGTNNILVTDVVPNGMRFDTATGTNWTCVTLPANAGSTLTCTYTGPAPTLGQVLPPITVGATALGSAPFPPYTNCAAVTPLAGSGYVDSNAGNNNACFTVSKPDSCNKTCPAPQVMNVDGICACPAPMLPGAVLGTCICPQGTVLVDGKCVKRPPVCTSPQVPNVDGICVCPAPMLPGAVPGSCICPQGTVLADGKCVKRPPICTSPQVPNVDGICACPAPMLPGAIPGACICPGGSIMQNGKCVTVTRCEPPLILNAAGKCVKPDVKPRREQPERKPRQEQDEPRRPDRVFEPERIPGIGIPGIGGGFGGGGGGGSRGGGDKPGMR